MKDVPIGKDDFVKLRNAGCYYVDKTSLITEIVRMPGVEVFLFTRPRRFGKTLNLRMLNSFFNIAYEGNDWFAGLQVMNDERCKAVMNSYPVIFLDLKGLSIRSMDSFLSEFATKISNICKLHKYLFDSDVDAVSLKDFSILYNKKGSREDLEVSLELLTQILHEYHGKEVIVLIDEYDNAINNSYGTDEIGRAHV